MSRCELSSVTLLKTRLTLIISISADIETNLSLSLIRWKTTNGSVHRLKRRFDLDFPSKSTLFERPCVQPEVGNQEIGHELAVLTNQFILIINYEILGEPIN